MQVTIRSVILDKIERSFWSEIAQTKDASWKKTLLNNWARRVETDRSQNILISILNSSQSTKPLTLDQDTRWLMLQRLSALGHAQAEELIAKEKANDSTETGFKSYLAAQAAKPSMAEKTKLLEEMKRPDANWSLARKQTIMNSLFPPTPLQLKLREEFKDQFYKTMSILNKKSTDVSYNRTYANLAPSSCEENSIREFENFINTQEWHVVTKKVLLIQNHENKICARVRAN
jgi:hypothetical protein